MCVGGWVGVSVEGCGGVSGEGVRGVCVWVGVSIE